MNWQTVLLLIPIIIALLGHMMVSVWWASNITTVVTRAQQDLSNLVIELKSMREMFYRKEDAIRDLAQIHRDQEAMWKRIDEMREFNKGHNDK